MRHAWCAATLALILLSAGCIEPDPISDPDVFARILARSDGGLGADGGGLPGGRDASAPAPGDGCGDVVVDYLRPTCGTGVACHGAGASTGLDLESPMVADRLIDVEASAICAGHLYIDPDDPAASLVLTKLSTSPPCGSPMPLGARDPPSEAEKACVQSWIEGLVGGSGAPTPSTPDAGTGSGSVDAGPRDAGANCENEDNDNDGTNNCDDICPDDPNKTEVGLCGCGEPDTDGDGDGVADCDDGCPADAAKTAAGQCGCGTADTDGDGDGTADCNDGCPGDPGKTAAGVCGCGTSDNDTDSDGTLDCNDGCPLNPATTSAPCEAPGLLVGELSGAFNLVGPQNGSEGIDSLGPTRSEILDGPENTTYVYTGEIYVPASGVLSFYENYDDSVLLEVDGQQVLNDQVWDAPTAGSITRAEGWYSFELRLGNGVMASGPPVGIGFGYASVDTAGSTDPAMYSLPRNSDASTANLFRVP